MSAMHFVVAQLLSITIILPKPVYTFVS